MDIKEALKKLKTLIVKFEEQNPDPKKEEANLEAVELEDGTKINCTPSVEMGSKVTVVTDQGEVDAPNGTLKLKDGRQVVVEKGVIIEVIAAGGEGAGDAGAPAAEEQGMKQVDEAIKAELKKVTDALTALTEKFSALEIKFMDVKKQNETLKVAMKDSKEILSQTFGIVEKMSELPAKKQTEEKKSPKEDTSEERLEAIGEALSELRGKK